MRIGGWGKGAERKERRSAWQNGEKHPILQRVWDGLMKVGRGREDGGCERDGGYGNPPYNTQRCRAGFHTRRFFALHEC